MTNAWAGGKVAIRGGAPRRTPRESAAALIAVRPISENAGELGWIRASEEALGRLFGMPAALLCRTFYLVGRTARPVDGDCRSAAIGTQNA